MQVGRHVDGAVGTDEASRGRVGRIVALFGHVVRGPLRVREAVLAHPVRIVRVVDLPIRVHEIPGPVPLVVEDRVRDRALLLRELELDARLPRLLDHPDERHVREIPAVVGGIGPVVAAADVRVRADEAHLDARRTVRREPRVLVDRGLREVRPELVERGRVGHVLHRVRDAEIVGHARAEARRVARVLREVGRDRVEQAHEADREGLGELAVRLHDGDPVRELAGARRAAAEADDVDLGVVGRLEVALQVQDRLVDPVPRADPEHPAELLGALVDADATDVVLLPVLLVRVVQLPDVRVRLLLLVPRPVERHEVEPERVDPGERVAADVGVGVRPAEGPDRVAREVAPGRRIVVPQVVVVRPGLDVRVLAREPERQRDALERDDRLAERRVVGAPDGLAVGVGHQPRRAAVVGVDRVHLAARDPRDGAAVEVEVLRAHATPPVDFRRERRALVEEERHRRAARRVVDGLADPLAVGVVAVAREEPAVAADRDRPALEIVLVVEPARGFGRPVRAVAVAPRGPDARAHPGVRVRPDARARPGARARDAQQPVAAPGRGVAVALGRDAAVRPTRAALGAVAGRVVGVAAVPDGGVGGDEPAGAVAEAPLGPVLRDADELPVVVEAVVEPERVADRDRLELAPRVDASRDAHAAGGEVAGRAVARVEVDPREHGLLEQPEQPHPHDRLERAAIGADLAVAVAEPLAVRQRALGEPAARVPGVAGRELAAADPPDVLDEPPLGVVREGLDRRRVGHLDEPAGGRVVAPAARAVGVLAPRQAVRGVVGVARRLAVAHAHAHVAGGVVGARLGPRVRGVEERDAPEVVLQVTRAVPPRVGLRDVAPERVEAERERGAVRQPHGRAPRGLVGVDRDRGAGGGVGDRDEPPEPVARVVGAPLATLARRGVDPEPRLGGDPPVRVVRVGERAHGLAVDAREADPLDAPLRVEHERRGAPRVVGQPPRPARRIVLDLGAPPVRVDDRGETSFGVVLVGVTRARALDRDDVAARVPLQPVRTGRADADLARAAGRVEREHARRGRRGRADRDEARALVPLEARDVVDVVARAVDRDEPAALVDEAGRARDRYPAGMLDRRRVGRVEPRDVRREAALGDRRDEPVRVERGLDEALAVGVRARAPESRRARALARVLAPFDEPHVAARVGLGHAHRAPEFVALVAERARGGAPVVEDGDGDEPAGGVVGVVAARRRAARAARPARREQERLARGRVPPPRVDALAPVGVRDPGGAGPALRVDGPVEEPDRVDAAGALGDRRASGVVVGPARDPLPRALGQAGQVVRPGRVLVVVAPRGAVGEARAGEVRARVVAVLDAAAVRQHERDEVAGPLEVPVPVVGRQALALRRVLELDRATGLVGDAAHPLFRPAELDEAVPGPVHAHEARAAERESPAVRHDPDVALGALDDVSVGGAHRGEAPVRPVRRGEEDVASGRVDDAPSAVAGRRERDEPGVTPAAPEPGVVAGAGREVVTTERERRAGDGEVGLGLELRARDQADRVADGRRGGDRRGRGARVELAEGLGRRHRRGEAGCAVRVDLRGRRGPDRCRRARERQQEPEQRRRAGAARGRSAPEGRSDRVHGGCAPGIGTVPVPGFEGARRLAARADGVRDARLERRARGTGAARRRGRDVTGRAVGRDGWEIGHGRTRNAGRRPPPDAPATASRSSGRAGTGVRALACPRTP